MSFLKGLFDFGKPVDLGPSIIDIDSPAPDDEKGVGWKDRVKMEKLIRQHSTLINENSLEFNCLCDFVQGHIIKDHGLDESIHLEYQRKCKNILLNADKSEFRDDRKVKLINEIVSTIEDIDFDQYPQTAKNLTNLMDYVTIPDSKGLFLCTKSPYIRKRVNLEGAVASILREKDNPNFVFDENNRFIQDLEANYLKIFNLYTTFRTNLDELADQEEKNLGRTL